MHTFLDPIMTLDLLPIASGPVKRSAYYLGMTLLVSGLLRIEHTPSVILITSFYYGAFRVRGCIPRFVEHA